ncbi:alpha/beta hydrolase [Candidatus Woesebacteria bacterium]|nr:alpha/beta hydrolase [Candidatus Woesebacteria bacterium]
MSGSIETSRLPVDSIKLPFIPGSSTEFQAALKAVSFTETTFASIDFHQRPNPNVVHMDGSRRASLAWRWLLPQPGTLYDNLANAETGRGIQLTVALHGFGCAQLFNGGGEQFNYFTAVTAASGTPTAAPDWAGYNCQAADAGTFDNNPWMTEIDQNPYLLLDFLEQLADNISPSLTGFPKEKKLIVNLMGHSVGGRSLLVAASIDGGKRLLEVKKKWELALGRPVEFQLTALEPAFGMPRDAKIGALRLVDHRLFHTLMKLTPATVLTALQVLLSMQAEAYGLGNPTSYPFGMILQSEHIPQLVAHPAAIRQPPKTKILSPAQLRALGYSVVIVIGENDRLVSNRATQEVLGDGKWSGKVGGVQQTVRVTDGELIIEKLTQQPGLTLIQKSGHTPEVNAPTAIAALIRFLHSQQSQ